MKKLIYSVQDDTLVTTIDNQNTINQMLDIGDWEEAEQLPDEFQKELDEIINH